MFPECFLNVPWKFPDGGMPSNPHLTVLHQPLGHFSLCTN
jgi:hypothetical protein